MKPVGKTIPENRSQPWAQTLPPVVLPRHDGSDGTRSCIVRGGSTGFGALTGFTVTNLLLPARCMG